MSDNCSFSVVVTEGIHDVAAISKILGLKGFQEAQTTEEIPDFLRKLIPTSYPFEGKRLSRLVPFPSFFFRGEDWILVSRAGSDDALAKDLKGILNAPHKMDIISRLCGAAILADADTKTAEERRDELHEQLVKDLSDNDEFQFVPSAPTQIMLYEKAKPFDIYIFPDNQHTGRLEQVLLQGAEETYPELYSGACDYVELAKAAAPRDFNEKKAIVGAITSVLRSGRAPQASIRNDNWFTEVSLSSLPLHKTLSDFIDTVIGWAGNRQDPPPSADQQDEHEMAYSS